MPSVILPAGRGTKTIPTPTGGKVSVRDMRTSLRLADPDYRLMRRTGDGKLVEVHEDELLGPDDRLQAVPRTVAG